MEKFLNLNWRLKLLFIFLLMVLIYGVIFSISLNQNKKEVIEKKQTSKEITPSPTPILFWKTHSSDKYEIAYPSDWNVEVIPIAGGSLTSYSPKGEKLGLIHIKAMEASKSASMEKWISSFSQYKLVQKDIIFKGIQAVELKGIMPWGENKAVIIFENKGYLYIIDYGFFDKTDSVLIDTLEKAVGTFELN